MRIILTVNFSPWSAYAGGGQKSTHEIARALRRLGEDVTVVYTRSPWERVAVPEDLSYRVVWAPFVALRGRRNSPLRPLNALTVRRTVDRLLGEDGADIVHSQGEEGALLAGLRPRRRFGFVVTPRYPNLPAPFLREGGPRPWEQLRLAVLDAKYLLLGRALRAADLICPTSRSSAVMLHRAFALDDVPVEVTPNGIDPLFFAVERAADAADGPIVFFGRVERTKGVDVLLEALGRLGEAAPETWFVGRGDAEPWIAHRAGELGLTAKVRLLGWRSPEQLAGLLARARLAVLPSREESFGNAMVEAQAAGVPLITGRAGSVPEVVDEGRTALLVDPDEPDELAAAMRALLDDTARAERLGAEGRRWVAERYSWDAAARRYRALYQEYAPR